MPTHGDNEAKVVSGVDYSIALSAELEGPKLEVAQMFAEFLVAGEGQRIWVNTMQGFPAAEGVSAELSADENPVALESVQIVTEALADAEFPRK